MLLNKVLSELKAAGFTRATIGVSPKEERNIKLYRSQGFVKKVKECYIDPCAMDKNMRPKSDGSFWLLASDGMLVKRPLLVTGKGVFPGFKEESWRELL